MRNFKKMKAKSRKSVAKEMDLLKFIQGQRWQATAILGLLTGRQSFFVEKLSQMVINESSDLDESSSMSENNDWQKDTVNYAHQMLVSQNSVD